MKNIITVFLVGFSLMLFSNSYSAYDCNQTTKAICFVEDVPIQMGVALATFNDTVTPSRVDVDFPRDRKICKEIKDSLTFGISQFDYGAKEIDSSYRSKQNSILKNYITGSNNGINSRRARDGLTKISRV